MIHKCKSCKIQNCVIRPIKFFYMHKKDNFFSKVFFSFILKNIVLYNYGNIFAPFFSHLKNAFKKAINLNFIHSLVFIKLHTERLVKIKKMMGFLFIFKALFWKVKKCINTMNKHFAQNYIKSKYLKFIWGIYRFSCYILYTNMGNDTFTLFIKLITIEYVCFFS